VPFPTTATNESAPRQTTCSIGCYDFVRRHLFSLHRFRLRGGF
jgi:hypothetical protein